MSASNQHSVAIEARRWVVRLDGLCAAEKAELDRWLEASERHRAAFAKAKARWQSLEYLTVLPDDPAAYGEPEVRVATNEVHQARSRRPAWPLALAATLAAIAVVISILLLPQEYRGEYFTETGKQLRVGLPDGSVMLLNTDTRLEVHFTDDGRRVVLERGEAYFDVVTEPERPFDVAAGPTIVRAMGTAFTVHVHDEELEVTVADGEVEIARRSESASSSNPVPIAETRTLMRVAAVHTARVVHDQVDTVSPIDAETIERKLAWQRGMLSFVNAPLGDVIADVSRYTDKTIEIADPELVDYPVTVIARTKNIEGLLANLDASTDALSVTRVSEDRIVISSVYP